MRKCFLHGEVAIFSNSSIPKDAKIVNPINNKYILADSETTGNHHVLEAIPECEVYEKDGILYLKTNKEVTVCCVHTDRHDSITLEPGCYEIDKQQEYDYFEQRARNIKD